MEITNRIMILTLMEIEFENAEEIKLFEDLRIMDNVVIWLAWFYR